MAASDSRPDSPSAVPATVVASVAAAGVAPSPVTRAAAVAADTALTLPGAIGYTWEHALQIFYKRAKLDAELFGSSRAWNERLATELDLGEVPWTSN